MWANFFLLSLIGGLTYAGYKRGLVAEVFDWITVMIGVTFALRLYRPVGDFFHGNVLAGFTASASRTTLFWLLFLPVAALVFLGGLHLDRVTRDHDRIPEPVRNYGGLAVGFLKSLVLSTLFVAWFPSSGMLAPIQLEDFHKAPVVNWVRGNNGLAMTLVRVAAPSDLAKQFQKMMDKR